MIVSLQFGLACRNQEAYGLRWGNLGPDFIDIIEVLSWGEIDEGKTAGSTPRRSTIPSLLVEDLATWKVTLSRFGYRTEDNDFIIAGNLTGEHRGKRDLCTGSCHFTQGQAKHWGRNYLRVAVNGVAKSVPGMSGIEGATPYALRRGGMATRLHSEDPQVVAEECGTSLQMLDRYYSFAMDEFRRQARRPVDVVWREARHKVAQGKTAATKLRAA